MIGKLLVTGVTFSMFMTEALIHYNMGMAKDKGKNGERHHFQLPPPKELAWTAAVTGVFSVASGLVIGSLNKHIPPKV